MKTIILLLTIIAISCGCQQADPKIEPKKEQQTMQDRTSNQVKQTEKAEKTESQDNSLQSVYRKKLVEYEKNKKDIEEEMKTALPLFAEEKQTINREKAQIAKKLENKSELSSQEISLLQNQLKELEEQELVLKINEDRLMRRQDALEGEYQKLLKLEQKIKEREK